MLGGDNDAECDRSPHFIRHQSNGASDEVVTMDPMVSSFIWVIGV